MLCIVYHRIVIIHKLRINSRLVSRNSRRFISTARPTDYHQWRDEAFLSVHVQSVWFMTISEKRGRWRGARRPDTTKQQHPLIITQKLTVAKTSLVAFSQVDGQHVRKQVFTVRQSLWLEDLIERPEWMKMGQETVGCLQSAVMTERRQAQSCVSLSYWTNNVC